MRIYGVRLSDTLLYIFILYNAFIAFLYFVILYLSVFYSLFVKLNHKFFFVVVSFSICCYVGDITSKSLQQKAVVNRNASNNNIYQQQQL